MDNSATSSSKAPRKVGPYIVSTKLLGKGNFPVYEAIDIRTNKKVAAKIFKKPLSKLVKDELRVHRYISALSDPRKTHVAQAFDVIDEPEHAFLFMELANGGCVLDMMEEQEKRTKTCRLSEEKARHIFKQLIAGVRFLHDHDCIHRDLKADNILIFYDAHLRVTAKLADFGYATITSENGRVFDNPVGSPQYVSPEMLTDGIYDGTVADVWALGVILYVLLAGNFPFSHPVQRWQNEKICNVRLFLSDDIFSPTAQSLLRGIFQKDTRQRFTLDQIENHPWLEEGTAEAESYTVRFSWPIECASQVSLAGSFNAWSSHVELKRNAALGVFDCELLLPKGQYHYKFIVDGKWQCDKTQPVVVDDAGHENNSLTVPPLTGFEFKVVTAAEDVFTMSDLS